MPTGFMPDITDRRGSGCLPIFPLTGIGTIVRAATPADIDSNEGKRMPGAQWRRDKSAEHGEALGQRSFAKAARPGRGAPRKFPSHRGQISLDRKPVFLLNKCALV
jgi:hypothetical protein